MNFQDPIINITIPTFNRLELTKKCIFSLKKYTNIPHVVTVVDNNSTDGTQDFLVNLKENGMIDYLYLLDQNMGVSCASNFGFDTNPTPLYMKLDNDMEVTQNKWLLDILELWANNPEVAILGPSLGRSKDSYNEYTLKSGTKVFTTTANLAGAATIISRDVFNRLGYWNEDYGLYGEEDADYSHRAKLANYLLICFESGGKLVHHGTEQNTLDEYKEFKTLQRNKNLTPTKVANRFATYSYLYDQKILSLRCERRYIPIAAGDYKVTFIVNNDFIVRKKFAERCAYIAKQLIDSNQKYMLAHKDFIGKLIELRDNMGVPA